MKRSKEAIITKVLEICKDGSSKTAIVYQANLNFQTAVPYINLLIKKGMLEVVDGRPVTYLTTPAGIKVLEELKCIRGMLPEIYDFQAFEKNLV